MTIEIVIWAFFFMFLGADICRSSTANALKNQIEKIDR